ncbi:16S rRNA (cytosine(967)-C(5))-methyltransferase RsmB [Staphylococcus canis]|uniref:16S rRNA (cytosine(967)-C(5))-methyltransferase n=1 Tax=Staphylococcus canis TaxID=2724942 RepID=A0ABS0T742_9STAP|nr:16S rRNA (cytosine(967)-C(5))-methyltransferase RsmB [Staphylococcus canis]MBI5974561.1 16S rRNA (cytosine(967)-C(5))-methyltransferase RsmB [Staphylococcus canis]
MVQVRALSFQTLEDVLKDGAYSNLKINEVLSKNNLSQADKGLYTEIVYGTIKRKLTLNYYLKPFVKTKIKGWVRRLLWMSIYQYVYLDKVPTHAIINEAVDIAKKRGGAQTGNTVNAILRQLTSQALPKIDDIRDKYERASIRYSIPVWIIKHWETHYGFEVAETIAEQMLHPVSQTVRVNTTRITVEDAMTQLEAEGLKVQQDPHIKVCLHVLQGVVVQSTLFKEGLVSIQDKSSMFVSLLMDLKSGDDVLDSCSAPGGKTCHMAEILDGKGHIIAHDIHEHKIQLIQHNIDKLQLKKVVASQHDATKPIEGQFDKILVDAPCSGLGVLRHKPEIKYTMTPEKVEQLVQLQLKILKNVTQNLKPGGQLVYSTCTIEQMENENVIYTFLKAHPDFEFVPFTHPKTNESIKTLQILPQDFNSDGFFMTRIKKKG